MRACILLPLLSLALSAQAQTNLLKDGDFTASKPGEPLSAVWVPGKDAAGITVKVEQPGTFGEGKNWAHFTDETDDAAVSALQTFAEITGGRLEFTMHILQHDAAVWLVLGSGQVSKRADIALGIKVSSSGGLMVNGEKRIEDAGGVRTKFSTGETYKLYCTFTPSADGQAVEVTIGHQGGEVLLKGTTPSLGPISALAIRTHKEQSGSDFYLTDLSLTALP